jgi:hypothetical protein
MFFKSRARKSVNNLDYMSNLSALISNEVYKPIQQRRQNIQNYILDRSIESDIIVVYYNDANKDVIMGIRGTKTASDLYSDFLLGLQQITNIKAFINSDRFKNVKNKLENVIDKYDKLGYNIRITGHSLAGFETIKLAQKYNQVDNGVAFNAGSVPVQLIKDNIPDNVEHFRNPRDIISYGWRNDKQTTEYINKNKLGSYFNPLKNHTINYFT